MKSTQTIADISTRFNELLQQKPGYRNGNANHDEYIEALNEATLGNWSFNASHESDRGDGIGEMVRLFMKMGESPQTKVSVTLEIPAKDGTITRSGVASDPDSGHGDASRIEKTALVNAIRTLRTGG